MRAYSSVVEHFTDNEEALGSIPSTRTNFFMACYVVRFLDRKEITSNTIAFFFEKPSGFEFRPGQFVELTLLNPPYADAQGNTRPFSIASSPREGKLMFATRMRNTAFKKSLKEMPIGTEASIEGPFGSFTFPKNTEKKIVILAGGIGITPFRSMVKHAAETKAPHKIFLFYSNREQSGAPFLKELRILENENMNYKFIPTMTGDSVQWSGERGYISKEMVLKYIDKLELPTYYIAGPQAFVAAMFQILKLAGVDEDNIHTEEFPGY